VIVERRPRALPVELTADPRITARVRRLIVVSVVALGVIWALERITLVLPEPLELALAFVWVLMPVVLAASLAVPRLRYLLVGPALLESLALIALAVGWLPEDLLPALGWLLIASGILVGGTLGLWLWYRLLPVPTRLDDPLAPARWVLISVHVVVTVAGMLLASTPLWSA
jgi:hypothetical protein